MKMFFLFLPLTFFYNSYMMTFFSISMLYLMNFKMLNLSFQAIIFFLVLIFLYFFLLKPYCLSFSSIYMSELNLSLMNFTVFFCLLFFLSKSNIMLFLFFELSIIPMFFLLILFGLTERKIIASSYLMIYTMIFSMIFISSMMLSYFYLNSFFIEFFSMNYLSLFISLTLSLMFLVKIPMFFIHIWLPKAHLESSNMGSMMLAGILLKLGSYGLMLFFNFNFWFSMNFNYFIMIYMIYIYFICLSSFDFKTMVAFFSIAHMAIIISSLIMKTSISMKTCIMMMISHTISSSSLFLLMSLFYNNYSSRVSNNSSSMIFHKSMATWSLYYFLCLNMSIPPSLNFFSEMYFVYQIYKISTMMLILAMIMILLSGVVSVLILLKTFFMKENKFIYYNSYSVNMYLLIKTFLMVSFISIFMFMKM